jgi:RNA polymerase sigma-70 factor (ECF subfamily)
MLGGLQLIAGLAVVPRPGRGADRDAELVARLRSGDRGAFAQLYEQHVDAVYARITRLVGPVAEREDLVQETFLGVFRALPTFRGEAALATLLYRITINVACEHLRRRARRPTVPLDEAALERLVAPDASPEASARRRQEVARVLRCLDRIKPKKRVALLLRVVEGLAIEEIAALVDATPDAVAKRVQHAMKELVVLMARAEAKEAER